VVTRVVYIRPPALSIHIYISLMYLYFELSSTISFFPWSLANFREKISLTAWGVGCMSMIYDRGDILSEGCIPQ